MLNSKNNFFIFLSVLTVGCTTTSTFKIYSQKGLRTEIIVSADRVVLDCEKLDADGEDDDRYGFMIHVLDEENTVVDITQANILGKSGCFERKEAIAVILKRSKLVYFSGIGTLTEPRVKEKWSYDFPKKGRFFSNGRGLSFDFVKGDNGRCYTSHEGETCAQTQFIPIAPLPF